MIGLVGLTVTLLLAQVGTKAGGGSTTGGWVDEPEQKALSLPFYQAWSPAWYTPVQNYNRLRVWSTPESLSSDPHPPDYVRLIENSTRRVWPERTVHDALAFMRKTPAMAYEFPLPDQMITHVVVWQRAYITGTHYLAAWPLNLDDVVGCRALWADPITSDFATGPFEAYFREWTGSRVVDTLKSAQSAFRIECGVFKKPVGTGQVQVVIFSKQ